MEPSKVEKFSTADRGNGLRALARLRPGELLFRSDPLAYTVCKGSRGVVCDRCLLGYVRSALTHLSPEHCGVRGAGGVGVRPSWDAPWPWLHGVSVLPSCPAPHTSRRAAPAGASRLTDSSWPLGCRHGGWRNPRLSPASLQSGAGPAITHPAAVGTGESR